MWIVLWADAPSSFPVARLLSRDFCAVMAASTHSYCFVFQSSRLTERQLPGICNEFFYAASPALAIAKAGLNVVAKSVTIARLTPAQVFATKATIETEIGCVERVGQDRDNAQHAGVFGRFSRWKWLD